MAYGGCAVLKVLPRHITEAILIVAAYLIPNVLYPYLEYHPELMRLFHMPIHLFFYSWLDSLLQLQPVSAVFYEGF